MGAPEVIALDRDDVERLDSLALALLTDDMALEACVAAAIRHGGMSVVAYQTGNDVYDLAQGIAERSGTEVFVTGPLPALSAFANDKLAFTDMVRRLFGENAVPVTRRADSFRAAARALQDLAEAHAELVVKVPSSAGGLGNLRFSRDEVRGKGDTVLADAVGAKLTARGWEGGPLLVGVWDQRVVSSPSVQMWIPCMGQPVVEGVFAQEVKGRSAGFVGASRATLSTVLTRQIVGEAMQIAQVLQSLGYQGRLSLDTVVLREATGLDTLFWIEANARWGGVSIPMTIGHRLNRGAAPCDLLVMQHRKGGSASSEATLHARNVAPLALGSGGTGYLRLLPKPLPVSLIAVYGEAVRDATPTTAEAVGA